MKAQTLTGSLMAPETQGKTVVVTGYLYSSSNRFWVTELEGHVEKTG